jgi:hypothetical protein
VSYSPAAEGRLPRNSFSPLGTISVAADSFQPLRQGALTGAGGDCHPERHHTPRSGGRERAGRGCGFAYFPPARRAITPAERDARFDPPTSSPVPKRQRGRRNSGARVLPS